MDGAAEVNGGDAQPVPMKWTHENSADADVLDHDVFLGLGEHVEAMGHDIRHDVVDQRGLHVRVVMTVVQRRAAGEEVDIFAALDVGQRGVLRLLEDRREAAAIAAIVAQPYR